ncbi:MAG: hypothetical protein ATN35_10290 [Epulopiscium sp. Nele67-Bin004]|nr:MAG: hypothetical protein ATN35_10290 [Epulopiscium sp. Nele67-Bin004]
MWIFLDTRIEKGENEDSYAETRTLSEGTIIQQNGTLYAPYSFFIENYWYDSIQFVGETEAITVKDLNVTVNGSSNNIRGCTIEGTNYISIRDFSDLLANTNQSFEIGWNDVSKEIELSSKSGINTNFESTKISHGSLSDSYIKADDRWFEIQTYSADGTTYFKLRDIANIFGVEIGWDATAGIIVTAE